MFKKLYRCLEKFQRTGLRSKNHIRVSNTFCQSTPISESENVNTKTNTRQYGHDRTNKRTKKAKYLSTSSTYTQFCVPNVFSEKTGSNQPSDFQSQKSESIRKSIQISPDKHASSTGFSARGGLGCENRSITSVFSHSRVAIPSTVPQSIVPIRTGRFTAGTVTNHMPPLRPVIGTQGIRDSFELGRASSPRTGAQSDRVFGRLSHSKSLPSIFNGTSCGSCAGSNPVGINSEFSKVCFGADQNDRLLGYSMESQPEFQIPPREQTTENQSTGKYFYQCSSMESQGCSASLGHAEFRIVCRSKRSASLPPYTNGLCSSTQRPATYKATHCSSCHKRVEMVGKCTWIQHSNSSCSSRSLPNNRRIGNRLGRSPQRYRCQRLLATKAAHVAQQSQRDVGDYSDGEKLSTSSSKCDCSDAVRQQECGKLHSQRGRSSFSEPVSSGVCAVPTFGQEQHKNSSAIHSRSVQHRSRPTIQTETARGVDALSGSLSGSIRSLRNTEHRLIRLSKRTRDYKVRIARLQRLERRISRRVQQRVALSQSLGVPSTSFDSSRPGTSQQGEGHVHTDSASMAQSLLASGPQGPSSECTLHNKQSQDEISRHTNTATTSTSGSNMSGGLVSEGWTQHLNDWSQNELQLLHSSWRQSTKKQYSCIWSKWTSWCNQKSINFLAPTGPQLAQYLAHLHLDLGLAYKTILVYKSTVSTLCTPNNSLSEDPFVKRILKSIALSNPNITKKITKSWDPRLVVEWLIANPPTTNTLFEVSRRTALILLLASSRRVHDLTLLHIDNDHYEDHSDYIVLHPVFGSKTDNYVHRQSSWKLTKAHNTNVCPVYWVKNLINLSQNRRSGTDLSELFITACGRVKAASRTTLGGWVKALLRAAGVSASAGSTRSAAASLNWLDNCPIDEVMAKGNWRTPNTFARFYSAEIRTVSNTTNKDNNLSLYFQSV